MSSTAINLSTLPAPEVVETLSFESIFAEMLADLRERDPVFAALVESDPAYKVLEVAAYRELLLRSRVNDAAQAVMLAYAKGSNLEQLAALYGVSRLTSEDDTSLRTRTQLALEGFSTAGPVGAYRFHALSAVRLWADAEGRTWQQRVRDVAISSTTPGRVDVVVLAEPEECLSDLSQAAFNDYDGSCWGVKVIYAQGYTEGATSMAVEALPAPIASGTAIIFQSGAMFTTDADALLGATEITGELVGDVSYGEEAGLLNAVLAAVSSDEVRPLTDMVTVKSARIVPFTVSADLTVYTGPDEAVVKSTALLRLQSYVAGRHRLGSTVTASGLTSAAHVEGVHEVVMSPDTTLEIAADQAAYCPAENVEVNIAGRVA